MKIPSLWHFLFVICFLGGFFDARLAKASDRLPVERSAILQCKVDSHIYSAPYQLSADKVSGVPLSDGTSITINWNGPGRTKVLIQGESRFRSCDNLLITIADEAMARNLLSETKISETSIFVGANVGVCRTADEGWFFMLKKNVGYIGYAGPAPLPLAVVGMQCE